MEVKSRSIGPLICEKCGKIAYHHVVFKTRWYAPLEFERVWMKSNLRCCSCEKEYPLNKEAKKQYQLYKKNFGEGFQGATSFELILLNVAETYQIVSSGVINEENLAKAVKYLMDTYGKSQGFDYSYYERYLRLLSIRLKSKGIQDKYFK